MLLYEQGLSKEAGRRTGYGQKEPEKRNDWGAKREDGRPAFYRNTVIHEAMIVAQ